MMQGVLTSDRVRLLLTKNHKCYRPRRRGEREPKRASKIRKYYNLDKKLDRVENYVIRNPKKSKYKGEVKTKMVGVKIQRLTTPKYVSRKKRMQKMKSERYDRTRELKKIHANLCAEFAALNSRSSRSPSKKRKAKA